MSEFTRPRAIQASDPVAEFNCGKDSLTNWLRTRAVRNESNGSSRTFVSIERITGLVGGYYCSASHSLVHDGAPRVLRQNSPNPIPVTLIGRLAVDVRFAGQGLGSSLLRDAVIKGIEAASRVASRAFIVHALDDEAASFYAKWGFAFVPESERTMYLLMQDAAATVSEILSDYDG